MARRVKVFFVVLFSACLFSFSALADFGISDSSNLGLIESWCESISNNIISYFDPSRYTSFSYQALSKLDSIISSFSTSNSSLSSISSQLQSILHLLGKSDKDFNTDNAIYCFDSYHYNGDTDESLPGMLISSSDSNLVIFQNTASRYLSTYIPPGTYILLVNIQSNGQLEKVQFEANAPNPTGSDSVALFQSDFRFVGTFGTSSRYQATFQLNDGLYFGDFYVQLSFLHGGACAYLYEVSGAESIVSSNNVPNINSHGQELNQGVSQLDSLEEQVFGSLDTSLGSIDFSGSALGQVVSGFNFIRAVFSAIYSSSPYISVLINLSCMFGVLALFLRVQPRFSRWEREHRDRSN